MTEEFYRSQAVGRAAKAAGQAKVNPYVLLHTFASLSVTRENCPVTVVSALMGHSTVTLTLNTYAHLSPTKWGHGSTG